MSDGKWYLSGRGDGLWPMHTEYGTREEAVADAEGFSSEYDCPEVWVGQAKELTPEKVITEDFAEGIIDRIEDASFDLGMQDHRLVDEDCSREELATVLCDFFRGKLNTWFAFENVECVIEAAPPEGLRGGKE